MQCRCGCRNFSGAQNPFLPEFGDSVAEEKADRLREPHSHRPNSINHCVRALQVATPIREIGLAWLVSAKWQPPNEWDNWLNRYYRGSETVGFETWRSVRASWLSFIAKKWAHVHHNDCIMATFFSPHRCQSQSLTMINLSHFTINCRPSKL